MKVVYKHDATTPPTLAGKSYLSVNRPYTINLKDKRFLPDSVNVTGATAEVVGDDALTVTSVTHSDDTVVVYLSYGTLGLTPQVKVTFVTDLDNGIGGFYSDTISFYVPIVDR